MVMNEEETAEFAKEIDALLLPIFQALETGILEIWCWIQSIITAAANAIAPPLNWLFED